jgi:hypothetical protein
MVPARMLIICVFALGAALVSGCTQKPATLNHVNGKVFYKGTILRTGVIVFTPDASRGESGKVAFGTIKDDGSYIIATDDAPGAAAGWYRVTVGSLTGTSASYDSTPISLIPEKYRDPLLSQLQCEVKANRDNHLDFNLD